MPTGSLQSSPETELYVSGIVMRVYMMSQFRDQRTMSDLEYTLVLAYALSHLCRRVCLKWRVYMPLGASFFSPFFEDALLVEFMYPVFSRMP